jgi:hypothetical protein
MRSWLEVVTTNSCDEYLAQVVNFYQDGCLETAAWLPNSLDDAAFRLDKTLLARQGLDVVNVVASDKIQDRFCLGEE